MNKNWKEKKGNREVVDIVKENTTFMWDHETDNWGGLSQDDLTGLTGEIAELLGIKPEQAEKIKVYFGDNVVIRTDDSPRINTASCITDFDDENEVETCRLIINRSKEVAQFAIGESGEGIKGINCYFQTPPENIAWLIAEELKHAHIFLIAGSKEKNTRWQQKYLQILEAKGRITEDEDDYMNSLQEVAVSRNAVRVLAKLFPERSEYFRDLYERSIQTGRQISPNVKNVIEIGYIETGFDPSEIFGE